MSGGLGWYAYDHMEPVEMSLHMDIGLDPSKT
jgi:hypothetical protein